MVELIIRNELDATPHEVERFVELVRSGGAVDEHYLRQGIAREGTKLVFAKFEGTIVAVAALKNPSDNYREGLEGKTKSGHRIPQDKFPFELGYVAVEPTQEGNGLGRQLATEVVRLSGGQGIFATTSNPAMRKAILPSLDFFEIGTPWKGQDADDLYLMIRKVCSETG